jgi:glycosyltransferase involved in cell wall biosynthesis
MDRRDHAGAASRVLAVALRDPFDVSTFSGLSARLFAAVRECGIDIVGAPSRDLRWTDFLTGALNLRGLMSGRFSGRYAPRVNPRWFWSRKTFELLSRRFDERLATLADRDVVLQIGTQIVCRRPGVRSFCVTDATIVQAVRANEFSISAAGGRVVSEAVEWQREIFESCDRVFVLSEWAAASVRDDYGIPAERVVVLGAGANVDRRIPRNPDRERPYVLFVGMDWEQKGGPLLLDAFRIVRERIPTARLIVVGCSPPVDDDGVEVVGRLSRSDPSEEARLFQLYAGAACFSILPTFDAFPNVLLEAGYFGVPIVSTDEGSRSEVVIDGVTGYLAKGRDASQVADLIARVLEDPTAASGLGAAAQRRVDERFVWPVVARRLIDDAGLSPRITEEAV